MKENTEPKPVDNSIHDKFMQLAIALSESNVINAQGGPFGAVITRNGKLIAKSANRVTVTNDPTAHAEISAIRLACKKLKTYDLEGCVIYTSCEPCPMCLSAIYWSRLDTVYYANTKEDARGIGFDDLFIYDEIALPYTDRKLRMTQLLRNEAQNAFKMWDIAENKTTY